MDSIITTGRRVFLVRFNEISDAYITQDKGLIELLKWSLKEKKTIRDIKASETYEPKFKRIAKERIVNQYKWNTEAIDIFKKFSYLHNVKGVK